MDNSLPPFNVGDEVVCVDDSPAKINGRKILVKGRKYKLDDVFFERGEWKVVIEETGPCHPLQKWLAYRFRRISPYQNSVSRSLAEQALKDTGDSRQDMKPERKEVLQ